MAGRRQDFNCLRLLLLYAPCLPVRCFGSIRSGQVSPDLVGPFKLQRSLQPGNDTIGANGTNRMPDIEPRLPVRFGVFEVDLPAGQLRRQGFDLKLQEQPFQILTVLLERPGEIVSREELQKRLWPADTFVDFERGLNRAINKLRDALADDADRPRFIETLPRRG